MRIALYDNLGSGGSKREAFELSRALSLGGHVVDLWTTSAADVEFLPMTDVTRHRYRYDWPQVRPLPPRLPGLRKYLAAAALIEQLRAVARTAKLIAADIDQQGYDFVFVHHCQPVQGPYLLRFLRTPSVYYCNEPMRIFYDPPVPRPYYGSSSRVERWQRRWYRPATRFADAYLKREDARNVHCATLLLTNSYFTAESIYRAYRRRACVSYLGVDADLFRPLDLPRENFVLSVGAVSPLKGYDFQIDALACLAAEARPELVIVGNTVSGAERSYLEGRAVECDVSVTFRENVGDAELVRLYNQARALIYSPILEPFGFAPLEAMACGTPVVAVAEGGVRESVRHEQTGLLAPRDPRRFAAELNRIMHDDEPGRRLAQEGIAAARSFWTWQMAAERFLECVRAAVPLSSPMSRV